jgi:hypothetical protein
VVITENCKEWILKFVEKRIKNNHNGQSLKDFISSSYDLRSKLVVKEALPMTSSSDMDITALCIVIEFGKLLIHGEEKSVGYQDNTTGDQIDRIRQIRNTFAHTAVANLGMSDYDDYINNIKDIGKKFERINGEATGTYTKQIEHFF